MIMVTKPAKLFSAELPAQYEMVQRKMANGTAQPILPVKTVKSKMKDGITEEKFEMKLIITSLNDA